MKGILPLVWELQLHLNKFPSKSINTLFIWFYVLRIWFTITGKSGEDIWEAITITLNRTCRFSWILKTLFVIWIFKQFFIDFQMSQFTIGMIWITKEIIRIAIGIFWITEIIPITNEMWNEFNQHLFELQLNQLIYWPLVLVLQVFTSHDMCMF